MKRLLFCIALALMISALSTSEVSAQINPASKLAYTITSVADDEPARTPSDFILYQNYPNPFNSGTKIIYDIQKADNVTLKLYDMLGREVATLVDGYSPANRYTVTFEPPVTLASGAYAYRLQSGGGLVKTKMMILLK